MDSTLNTYVNIRNMSGKESQWVVLISGPKTGCPIVRTGGKIIAVRTELHVPNGKTVAFIGTHVIPRQQRPQTDCHLSQ